ncbi:MAG: hypothetical protein HGA65_04710 [Oscillochloris sp.]|nr:hypothetical protein [Oscillochloris sp.]
MRRLIPLLALLSALLPAAAPTAARPIIQRCFPETGQCISGDILTYWQNNGGLAVFGYPITSERYEMVEGTWSGPTQWFERDRLENHSNEGKGVLAGRLAARYLEQRGTPWQYGPNAAVGDGCLGFSETGYQMCGAFRSYWEQNGGLARFGYPIGAPQSETIEGKSYTVQYFERRRMELHPEYVGTPYEVLLGLLGNMVYQSEFGRTCPPTPAVLQATADYYRPLIGCPAPSLRTNVATSWQPFANGMMLWVQNANAGGTIYVMYYDNGSFWKAFPDTYVEGEAINQDVVPPEGYYVPVRGFGKLWRDNEWVRTTLGYPTLPEVADVGLVQPFDDGYAQMVYRQGRNMVLIMFRVEQDGRGRALETPPT